MTFLGTLTDDDHKFALDYIDYATTGVAGTRSGRRWTDDRQLCQTIQRLLPYRSAHGQAVEC